MDRKLISFQSNQWVTPKKPNFCHFLQCFIKLIVLSGFLLKPQCVKWICNLCKWKSGSHTNNPINCFVFPHNVFCYWVNRKVLRSHLLLGLQWLKWDHWGQGLPGGGQWEARSLGWYRLRELMQVARQLVGPLSLCSNGYKAETKSWKLDKMRFYAQIIV